MFLCFTNENFQVVYLSSVAIEWLVERWNTRKVQNNIYDRKTNPEQFTIHM